MSKKSKFMNIFIFLLFFQIVYSFKYPINNNLKNSELSEITSVEISTKSEFDKYVKDNEYVISIFHADWCGHCKRFLPIFDEASKYKIINNKWKFLKISCSKYASLCSSFSIDGYPTIKTFKNSKEINRSPPRELENFLEFLLKMSNKPLIEIENNNINKFYNDYGTFSPIIEYNSKNNKFIECFNNFANNDFLNEYYFGLLKSKYNRIIFNFDSNSIIFNWNENCDDAKNFLKNNIYPLVSYIDIGLMRNMFRNKKTLFLMLFYSNNDEMNEFVNNTYKNISKDNRNLVFGYLHYDKDKDISSYFKINLTKESEIQILMYDFNKEIRYIHPSKYDSNIINQKELENEIRKLLKNINNLPFTSGNKFKDFLRKTGLSDMSETTKLILVILAFVLIVGCLIVMIFCCDIVIDDENDIKKKTLLNKNKKINEKQTIDEGKKNIKPKKD